MKLGAFLVGMVGPLMARWLASMGLSLVALTGLAASSTAIKSLVLSNLGSWPADALQLAGLYGCWEALGMIFGAVTFVITWASTKGFWSLAKT